MAQQLSIYLKEGFSRIEKDGEFIDISDYSGNDSDRVRLLIDRLSVSGDKDEISRLTDSLETALFEGDNECILRVYTSEGCMNSIFPTTSSPTAWNSANPPT